MDQGGLRIRALGPGRDTAIEERDVLDAAARVHDLYGRGAFGGLWIVRLVEERDLLLRGDIERDPR